MTFFARRLRRGIQNSSLTLAIVSPTPREEWLCGRVRHTCLRTLWCLGCISDRPLAVSHGTQAIHLCSSVSLGTGDLPPCSQFPGSVRVATKSVSASQFRLLSGVPLIVLVALFALALFANRIIQAHTRKVFQ